MTVDKLRFNLGNTNYDVPTKEYVDNLALNNGNNSNENNSNQSINLNDTPVGYITWQMALMENYLKLDGTDLASASTNYKELLDYATDNNLITNDFSNKVLFKYNNSTDILTLPNYIDLCLQGGNSVEEKEAGLPNIKGDVSSLSNAGATLLGQADTAGTGVFSVLYGTAKSLANTGGSGAYNYKFDFDASRSSSIYSDSVNTVQPPAITLIPQIKYRKDTSNNVLYNDTPIGTIISYMGVSVPKDYLICDGTIYNITDYKELAEYIKVQFGSYSYFGGDGTTTFAVPDLRGEFLRGTGTNSHTNQGNGASVGVHQNATEIPVMQGSDTSLGVRYSKTNTSKEILNEYANVDSVIGTSDLKYSGSATSTFENAGPSAYMLRPTNTSVLYCIKYNTSVLSTPENNYSTTEQRIGTWIDGKPLYQKTFIFEPQLAISYTNWTQSSISIADNNILSVIRCDAFALDSGSLNTTACYNVLCSSDPVRPNISFITTRNNSDDAIDGVTLKYTKTTD